LLLRVHVHGGLRVPLEPDRVGRIGRKLAAEEQGQLPLELLLELVLKNGEG
jgi:hypothetical protein